MSIQNVWNDHQIDYFHFQGSLKDFMEQQGEEVTFENTVGADLAQDDILRYHNFLNHDLCLGMFFNNSFIIWELLIIIF